MGHCLGHSNACQVLFPRLPPEGPGGGRTESGSEPSIRRFLGKLLEMGLVAADPATGRPLIHRGSPPPLASAATFRPAAPPSPALDAAGAAIAGASLRCERGFVTTAPRGVFSNTLGEHLGKAARGALKLPFCVLYMVEQLATSGALCPSLTKCADGLRCAALLCAALGSCVLLGAARVTARITAQLRALSQL